MMSMSLRLTSKAQLFIAGVAKYIITRFMRSGLVRLYV